MKQSKKETTLKEIRRVSERINELYREMRGVSVPLKNKMFVGHWRHFKVRADILRSSIGEQVQKIVEACDHWVLGKKNSPKSYRAYTEVCWGIGNRFVNTTENKQKLVSINQEAFDRIDIPTPQKRKWFYIKEIYRSYGSKNIVHYRYYPKVPDYMVEFTYKAAYVTEKFIPDGGAESELHYLNEWMTENNGWNRLLTNHKDEWDLNLDKKKMLDKLSKREIRETLTQEN